MSLIKITTKGRYALRMMVDLAEQETRNYISLKDVAGRQDISKKYLEQIVPALTQAGLLTTERGPLGGYRLARKPSEYTVAEILKVTEGNLAPVACLEKNAKPCGRAEECRTLKMWSGFFRMTNEYFDGITIADLMKTK